MIQISGAIIYAAIILIGPFGAHHEVAALVTLSLLTSALAIALVSNRSSHRQSLALLSVLAVLLYESLQCVTNWAHFELTKISILGVQEALQFATSFFTLNVGLALIGAAAAAVLAVSLQIRKTHLSLTKLFPDVGFATAPTELIDSVASISKAAGIAPPNVSLIDSGDPAAFITRSREGFELAVSVGLVESLNGDELEACIAHEVSHVKNNDFAVRSFATCARVALFGHPLSHLIEPAVYRAREFLADETAVRLVGRPEPLISALTKIKDSQNYAVSKPTSIRTACLFDSTNKSRFLRIFDHHPSLDARIKTLRELDRW